MSAPHNEAAFRSTKHPLHDQKNSRSDRKQGSSILPHYNFSKKYNVTTAKSPLPTHPPPAYSQSRDLQALNFGSAPSPTAPSTTTTELPPIHLHASHHDASQNTLPSISSVTGSQSSQSQSRYGSTAASSVTSPSYSDISSTNYWPSANPYSAYYSQEEEPPTTMEAEPTAPAKPSSDSGRASSVSLDDPDVRLAAEALGDLRADFLSSPPNRRTPLPVTSPTTATGPQPEPLISLLTTSHPLLAKTIEGTTRAYDNSKNFSPRIKSGVEYVEGYVTPISNALGSVGRATGVEGGVRWFLGSGRRNHSDDQDSAPDGYKRRKLDTPDRSRRGSNATITHQSTHSTDTAADPYAFAPGERRLSMSTIDTLPAYDDARSPAYTESQPQGYDGGPLSNTSTEQQSGPSGAMTPRPNSATGPAAWQSRLIMSTSGLSIAMSEESLRRLKYCLRWLRWANEHIAGVINALKAALEQYERGDDGNRGPGGALEPLVRSRNAEMVARIAELKGDILKTLREVIATVSKYAGGSLPENASILVRKHLTSLPQRFRLASQSEPGSISTDRSAPGADTDKETKEAAQRVLVLAKEGLDMMAQVSGVLDGTIVSAEEWCTKLGRKRGDEPGEGDYQPSQADTEVSRTRQDRDGDAVMSSL